MTHEPHYFFTPLVGRMTHGDVSTRRTKDKDNRPIPEDKQQFEKNTRACFKSLMLYTASVDTAWAALPNHERISELSFRILQEA